MSQGRGISKLKSGQNSDKRWQVNVLPCKIHYDGAFKACSRHWNPTRDNNGVPTVYFRGRRLKGVAHKLPPTYRGVVINPSSQLAKDSSLEEEIIADLSNENTRADSELTQQEEEDLRSSIRSGEYDTGEVRPLDQAGDVETITVWGHDDIPNETEEACSKALTEWIKMADAMHGNGAPLANILNIKR